MKTIESIKEKINGLREALAKESEAAIEPLMREIHSEFGVERVLLLGYTPGFNDGDPCTHGQHVAEEVGQDEDFLRERDFPGGYETWGQINGAFNALSDGLESAWGTNWQARISFENGVFDIERDEYFCGY